MELAEKIVDLNLQYCGNCQKVCVKDRARKDALFKLHIQSGLVDIPDDPTMIAHLEDANQELVPYDIEGTGYDLEDVDYGWVKSIVRSVVSTRPGQAQFRDVERNAGRVLITDTLFS